MSSLAITKDLVSTDEVGVSRSLTIARDDIFCILLFLKALPLGEGWVGLYQIKPDIFPEILTIVINTAGI